MRKICVLVSCLLLTVATPGQQTKPLTCTVKVVDYNARPLADAEVAVYERLYNYSSREEYAKLLGRIKKTDVEGCCVLNADIGSQHDVFIVARKKELALGWDILNSGSSYNAGGNIVIILEKPGTLAGTLVDGNGNPIAKAKVQAIPKTSYMSRLSQRPILAPKEWLTTETNLQGRFHFNQFSADVNCDFWVKAPHLSSTYKFTTHRLNGCGFEVWRSDVRLVLPWEGKIKGCVVEAGTGRPVGGVELTIRADRDREDIVNLYRPRTVVCDADGIACTGLAEGKHNIELAMPENEMAQWVAKSVQVNIVSDQPTDEIQVSVEKGGVIECTVREYGTERSLPQIGVSANSEACSARSVTDETGTAKLRVLPGDYRAYARGRGYISWRVNEPVVVKEGEVTHVDILLDKSPTIGGSAAYANGQTAEDILVTIHPFGDHVYADGKGQFVAGYDEKRTEHGLFVMARDLKRSLAALVLTKEFKKPVQLTLGPALTVKGKIIDPNGIGIPAARVSLIFSFVHCLSQFGAEVLTDPQGKFVFNAIPPVQSDFEYRVSVNAAGFGPKEYERITIDGQPGTTTEVQAIKLVPVDVSISGIVVDANGLPAALVPIFLRGADGFDQPDKSTATNKDGQFTIHRICKGPLRLQANLGGLPGGVEVGYLIAQGGDKDVKIILGQQLVHTKHVSLMRKPLPELKDLKINLSPADVSDKMMLVCFWDMQQRPSRHCVRQLSTRAQELKVKDVVVVAVQASKVDEKALNEWVKKYNIPFPVGMAQGNEEETRFNWGVRSLPWLILTDAEHIVRAEGFGLEELDEKLSEKTGVPLRPAKVGPVEDSPVSARSSRRPRKIPGKPLLRQTVRSASSKSSGRLIRVIGVARDENGKPVAGVEVRRLHGPGPVSTDARGMFELVWDPNRNRPLVDTYYIVARHEQHNLGVVVEVPEFEQDTKTVNMNLLPGVIFKGKVVDPAGGAIELARVDILLHTPTQGSGLYNTITDSEGRFEFNGIPAAHKYSFVAKASGYGSTWVHDIYVSRNLPQNRFELEPITLAIADESVSGVVVDANDKPISGARLSTGGKGQPQYYNIQTDAEGKFTIDGVCPGNLRIYATVSGEILLRGYARTHGGATNVRIVVTEIASPDKRRFVPKKPPSLVGKALPKLKDLGIELSSAEGSSKAILLCFFNIEQRPSRHCVTELAKRAEELKENGVTVVAVQASKIDENTLNEWVKEYNIPFPVGMIQGDEEKTRFTWGVRSLPWLILTNRKHIVRAEGFAISELDQTVRLNTHTEEKSP